MREKHLFKLASLLIAMLMGLAIVMSCSKDDGGEGGTNQDQYLSVNGTMWKVLANWNWDLDRSENYKSSLIFWSFNTDGTGEELMYYTDDDKYDNNRHEHYYTLTARWHVTFSKDGTKPITLYNIFLQRYYPTETAVEGHQMYLYHSESDNKQEICLCDNYGTPEYHGDHFTAERVYSLPTAEAIYADGTPYTGGNGGGSSSGGGSSYSNTETITCSLCNGSGKCRYCGGKGYSGTSTFNTTCFLCKGSGKCTSCDGHGYKEVTVNPNSGGNSGGGSSSGGNSSGGSSDTDEYISIKAVKIIAVTLNGSDWSYSGSTVNMYKKTSDGKVRLYSNAKRLIGTASSNSDSKCGDTNVRGYTYRVLDIDDLSSKTYYYFN